MPFQESTSITTKIFELLHVDLWGPYHIPTHDGYHYFLTMVDDYSRSTCTQLLRCKSNALQTIKAVVSLIETQFQTKLKAIRSDNGLEFTSSEAVHFFRTKGIIHQKTCPYTPQQNGVVERRHRHILETARAVKFQAGFPDKFWGLCIHAATHVLNRIPSTTLGNVSSFERLYGRPPLLDYMRVIGCLCFATNITTHDKFSPRAIRVVLMGYGTTKKGYKLYDLETRDSSLAEM